MEEDERERAAGPYLVSARASSKTVDGVPSFFEALEVLKNFVPPSPTNEPLCARGNACSETDSIHVYRYRTTGARAKPFATPPRDTTQPVAQESEESRLDVSGRSRCEQPEMTRTMIGTAKLSDFHLRRSRGDPKILTVAMQLGSTRPRLARSILVWQRRTKSWEMTTTNWEMIVNHPLLRHASSSCSFALHLLVLVS